MKTLDQVEPRIPVGATHTPGNGEYEAILKESGSYYLTANLVVNKLSGILITAPGVTLDLNGFMVRKAKPGSGQGITFQGAANGGGKLVNGAVSGFSAGVIVVSDPPYPRGGAVVDISAFACEAGISVGDGWRVENCTAHDNTGAGFFGDDGDVFVNCTAYNNHDAGYFTFGGTTMTNCSASNNQSDGFVMIGSGTVTGCASFNNNGHGIYVGAGSAVTNCSAHLNHSALSTSAGIYASAGSTVIGCSAYSNGTANATPSGATGCGIYLGVGATAKNCTVGKNNGDGIRADSNSLISENSCDHNGEGAYVGNGITATGNDNRIVGNTATHNDKGISIPAPGGGNLIEANHVRDNTGPGIEVVAANGKNVIIRNIAGNNVNSYTAVNPTGNSLAPIDTNFSSTNPFANFQN